MKQTLVRVALALTLGIGIMITFVSADPIKGGKIIDRAIHDDCAMPSSRLAMMHTVAEWQSIYAAGQMEAEVTKLCNRKITLKQFRPKYSKYVAEYLEHYANDSGAIPA